MFLYFVAQRIKNAKECIVKMLQRIKMAIRKNIEDKGDKTNPNYFDPTRNVDIKHFQLNEFDCNCDDCKGLSTGRKMDTNFLIKLDRARSLAKIPMKITSGVRCEKHNKAVGGVSNSSHMNIPCNAADISTRSSKERFTILKALLDAGFVRIGIGKNFIHCDTDKTKSGQRVAWDYY